MKIKELKAREILDSKSVPTVETYVLLEDGSEGIGAVPSGASTGDSEVLELRDGDTTRYDGKGVLMAVEKVNIDIFEAVKEKEFNTQKEFDQFLIELDGTELKTNLGGNSILSVSMAFCRASAKSKGLQLYEYFALQYWGENYDFNKLQLPQPQILIMEGGAHGSWSTDFQEYMIVPKKDKFPSFSEMLRCGSEVFHAVHDILHGKKYATGVGFEGAYSPNQMGSNVEAFEIMLQGVEDAGYIPGEEVVLALDIAASEFYDKENKVYKLNKEKKVLDTEEWLDLQEEWFANYPIWSIEDGMDQEDWDGWVKTMERFGKEHQIVGDDLLTTNVKRIQKGIELGAMNSVLIKLNQIGTVTETLDAINLAENSGFESIISHRGGETNDDMIADLVVGTAASQSKFGGPDRGERLAKYNRLLEIEAGLRE